MCPPLGSPALAFMSDYRTRGISLALIPCIFGLSRWRGISLRQR
ncbi:Uncharacterised protein [Vibrio cholerae]|nr:Uncharacterised protein [Vibrio cholerae]